MTGIHAAIASNYSLAIRYDKHRKPMLMTSDGKAISFRNGAFVTPNAKHQHVRFDDYKPLDDPEILAKVQKDLPGYLLPIQENGPIVSVKFPGIIELTNKLNTLNAELIGYLEKLDSAEIDESMAVNLDRVVELATEMRTLL